MQIDPINLFMVVSQLMQASMKLGQKHPNATIGNLELKVPNQYLLHIEFREKRAIYIMDFEKNEFVPHKEAAQA